MHMFNVCVQKLLSRKFNYVLAGALTSCMMASSAGAAETVEQKLNAQLAAGEFVPAMETALSATDDEKRDAMLRNLVTSMNANGLSGASKSNARLMKDPDYRNETKGDSSSSKVMNGAIIDFQTLIDLIQTQVVGAMWEDIDGTGGTLTPYFNGIKVDPQGILVQQNKVELNQQLSNLQQEVTKASQNADISKPSTLRMVSLTRLEKEIAEQLREGRDVVESMKNLAGLTEIKYVFFYPESQEVVIAGPAEGWTSTAQGYSMGAVSQKPVLQLDDMVTLLRTFSEKGEKAFGCSINPRAEGMKELKAFVEASQSNGPLEKGQTATWVKQLQDKLGMQDIEIYGVPASSRVARVIIEADYRMKLIGIGKLEGGSNIPDYFELMAKNPSKTSSLDALRWWLTLQCDKVLHSPEHTAYEVRGSKVLCQSENQFITAQGQHVSSGQTEVNNKLFATNFTNHFDELAKQDPVFADMKNIFDLAYVAAIINQEREANRVSWNPETFMSNDKFVVAKYDTPLTVFTVANHRIMKNHEVVVQVAGGVKADVKNLINKPEVTEVSPRLNQVAKTNYQSELPARRWWWDAAN